MRGLKAAREMPKGKAKSEAFERVRARFSFTKSAM
jgi:hypothetical protein